EIMTSLRTNPPKSVGGLSLVEFSDYAASITKNIKTGAETAITLPKSDVLVFALENEATIIIRPSGTEPKIKVYYTTTGKTQEEATALYEKLDAEFRTILGF
ncbi:MAG: phospho-sugar mutase, partial [Oscillospiraceae bacterium]|nr:phospho-sugar mutase [Oscillospiraceae bacterium]